MVSAHKGLLRVAGAFDISLNMAMESSFNGVGVKQLANLAVPRISHGSQLQSVAMNTLAIEHAIPGVESLR